MNRNVPNELSDNRQARARKIGTERDSTGEETTRTAAWADESKRRLTHQIYVLITWLDHSSIQPILERLLVVIRNG